MVSLISVEEYSYSFLLWPNIMTATSTEQRTDSSWAFLKRPPFRFRKVLRITYVSHFPLYCWWRVHGRGYLSSHVGRLTEAYTERFLSSLIAFISILRRPILGKVELIWSYASVLVILDVLVGGRVYVKRGRWTCDRFRVAVSKLVIGAGALGWSTIQAEGMTSISMSSSYKISTINIISRWDAADANYKCPDVVFLGPRQQLDRQVANGFLPLFAH